MRRTGTEPGLDPEPLLVVSHLSPLLLHDTGVAFVLDTQELDKHNFCFMWEIWISGIRSTPGLSEYPLFLLYLIFSLIVSHCLSFTMILPTLSNRP